MKQRSQTTLATGLFAALLASVAWAQFSNDAPGPAPGVRSGAMQRLPFAAGTVRAIDTTAGTITLTPLFGQGQTQTVTVTAATKITAQTQAKVSDLKVGELIQVRGVPIGINASHISDSDTVGSGLPGGPLDERVSGSAMQPDGGRGPWLGSAPAMAQATGKITSLSPLTLSVSPDVQIALKAAPDLKVTRNVTDKLSDLKVGDRIMATGQPSDSGTLTADQVRVNGYGPRGLTH